MKVLYISQFYEPESIAAAFRATEHSREWTSAGADVTVFTGYPNYPTGKIFDAYNVELLSESELEGVRLLRSKLVAKPNTSFINRVENGLSFLWYGLVNLRTNRNKIESDYDCVLATSGTVFAGYLGYKFARSLKKPFVIEFRDITYSQLVATGTTKKSVKYRLMKRLELFLANRAKQVIVVTSSLKETLVFDGISAEKIVVIPNGADIVLSQKKDHEGLRLGYFGTMGISQDVPESIRILESLVGVVQDFNYTLIGEGASRSDVEEAAKDKRFDFVALLHGMSKNDLEEYYSSVDMTVVSLRRTEAFAGTLPSKIFQSWARGVPVLFIGPEGEASELIDGNGAGIVLCGTDAENREKIVNFFSLDNWKEQITQMGKRSLILVEQKYTRKQLAASMLEEMKNAIR